MKHKLNLHPEPFAQIKSGLKVIEMRLFDERRKDIKVGDIIEFTNRETSETLACEVISLKRFQDFKELYAFYPKNMLGYRDDEVASPNDMSKYYSNELIEKYGTLAIGIRRI